MIKNFIASRRKLLAAMTAGAMLTKANISFASENKEKNIAGLKGKIIGVGSKQTIMPEELMVDQINLYPETIVNEPSEASNKWPEAGNTPLIILDLETGEVQHKKINSITSHSLVKIDDSGFACISYSNPLYFLNNSFDVRGKFEIPEGYATCGHALHIPGTKFLVTHLNGMNENVGNSYLAIIDTETFQLVKSVKTGIILGHDMRLLNDGKHFAVSDDGQNSEGDKNFTTIPVKPAIYIFSNDNFSLKKIIDLKVKGAPVHIEQDNSGNFIFTVEQGIKISKEGLKALENHLGKARNSPFLFEDMFANDFYPLPISIHNPETGRQIDIMKDKMSQFAPFDIRKSEKSGAVICSFIKSNKLIKIVDSNATDMASTLDFGVYKPYGLAPIMETDFMAVTSVNNTIAIFDVRNMKLVKKYDIETFGMKHMIHVA